MYEEWKESLTKRHDPEYYKNIIAYFNDIVEDINHRNQGLVAKDLNITPSKLSQMINLLRIYNGLNTSSTTNSLHYKLVLEHQNEIVNLVTTKTATKEQVANELGIQPTLLSNVWPLLEGLNNDNL